MAAVNNMGDGVLERLEKKHIYLSQKPGWYQIPNNRWPRFETMPNEVKYLVHQD
jgi:hypothetical protein